MALNKIKIENFKIFEQFELEFNAGLNILVGDNEAGKSTILEAIHLALTGMINGKYLNTELTPYLFNNAAVDKYICSLTTDCPMPPPQIKIELFFNECAEIATFMGKQNSDKDNDAHGFEFLISLNDTTGEYAELVKSGKIKTLPIEYYEPSWRKFDDNYITLKSIPIKSAMIDSSTARYQNGSDIYISRIVRQCLDPVDTIKVSQAHRNMLEVFIADPSVGEINKKISNNARITDKVISLSVELHSKNAWESSLVICVDSVPFHHIGKGEQSVIKTRLALADKKAKDASIILIEEPENHLTHARLNQLLDIVASECEGRHVIVSTHSSFVANKLGLNHIILLSDGGHKTQFTNLSGKGTPEFFQKLPGYDTLRLVLSRSVILVEGASDELVIQKAYMVAHGGKLPIADGIDVISVGTSFLRFLEIASQLNLRVAVVTDNDGKIAELKTKYADYVGENKKANILISYDEIDYSSSDKLMSDYNYNTLENLMLITNGFNEMNTILSTKYRAEGDLRKYMKNNKTECALSVFEYKGNINFPDYITKAITHVSQ
jgi:putative ATP-dependent endonuclease of OLD family